MSNICVFVQLSRPFFLQWYCFFFFLLFSNLFQVLNYKNCDNSERNFDFYCRHGLAVVDIVRQEPMACCSVAGSTRSNNTRCDAMPTDAWTGSPRQGGSTMSSDSKVAPMRPAKDRSWPLRTRLWRLHWIKAKYTLEIIVFNASNAWWIRLALTILTTLIFSKISTQSFKSLSFFFHVIQHWKYLGWKN